MSTTHNEQSNTPLNEERIGEIQETVREIKRAVGTVIVGQERLVERMVITLLCDAHLLLEGVPGLAKTTAINTLAQALNMDFHRIQFTPDLLPSDIVGSRIFNQADRSFSIKKGPVFTNFILADEINRAPAKVQSALLEAMQERQVTIGDQTLPLPKPFFVMATQNPIEQEGTYPLPEAQIDRFLFKTTVEYPTHEEELQIMNQAYAGREPVKPVADDAAIIALQQVVGQVYVDNSIKDYIARLVRVTRTPDNTNHDFTRYIEFGASPRASIGLLHAARAHALTAGRNYVVPEDVKEMAPDVLRHRIIPTYEAEAENITSDTLIEQILEAVPVP